MDIIGTWRLTRYTSLSPSGSVVEPFGSSPLGQLIYCADGGMSAVLSADHRAPDSRTISHEQASPPSMTDFIGYTGWWSREGDLIIHHVTASYSADQVGQAQIRHAALEDDSLVLSFTNHAQRGETREYRLTWRKMRKDELGR